MLGYVVLLLLLLVRSKTRLLSVKTMQLAAVKITGAAFRFFRQ